MKFKFPIIRPALPPPGQWLDELEASYAEKWFANFGPVTRKLETALTNAFCESDEVITTANSCTSGLAAALIALDARGEVAFPAFTFPATVSAILMAGATPLAVDVDEETWMLAPAALERLLREKKPVAVVLVIPFGVAQDITEQLEICRHAGAPVVIDNAAGLGGPVATLPDETFFEVYSLHATKVFAVGEGGAIRSKNTQARALHRALNFGLERGEPGGGWGINGKLPEMSAAVGLATLKNFETTLAVRRDMAARYIELMSKDGRVRCFKDVTRAPWQTFPMLFSSEDELLRLQRATEARGVEMRRYYRPSLEDWPRVARWEECPVARSLSERMACLPVYSDATAGEINEVITLVAAALNDLD